MLEGLQTEQKPFPRPSTPSRLPARSGRAGIWPSPSQQPTQAWASSAPSSSWAATPCAQLGSCEPEASPPDDVPEALPLPPHPARPHHPDRAGPARSPQSLPRDHAALAAGLRAAHRSLPGRGTAHALRDALPGAGPQWRRRGGHRRAAAGAAEPGHPTGPGRRRGGSPWGSGAAARCSGDTARYPEGGGLRPGKEAELCPPGGWKSS